MPRKGSLRELVFFKVQEYEDLKDFTKTLVLAKAQVLDRSSENEVKDYNKLLLAYKELFFGKEKQKQKGPPKIDDNNFDALFEKRFRSKDGIWQKKP